MKLYVFFVLLGILTLKVIALEKQITINVDPRRQDCFYETIKEQETVEVDYQVIDGAHTDLDISFQILDPTGRVLIGDFKKTGNAHTFTTQTKGDYSFCFDNTFSTVSVKTVFFELIIDNDDDENDYANELELNPEEVYELKVQDILEIIAKVKSDMNKVRQLQDIIKSVEARDRNVAEENHSTVNFFSFTQIMVMLIVGIGQVITVRSLFDEKSRVHRLWKKVNSR
ncbi:transmembrane emp24 domain-containing protein 5-like [Onthophagus taurus]|uniref:transmembrane emp24 domain-containing protein 5-like n=1 Tax=Onthophagus taurus TaxID=166361 RepID=UPI000C2023F5|nr:transmembrane emp24 domain-containing protein 5-like [Onthophagus taurus]